MKPPYLAFFEYAYDAEGRRISQTTAEGVERYTYDTVGQLTDVIYPDGSEEHFTYDAVGNRITSGGSRSVATETYTANNLNQYTAITGGSPSSATELTYDLDGNMTRKGDTRYYYDIQNRLVAVTNTTTDIAWSCEYDVFGNRTKVIDHGTAKETLFVQGSLASAVADYDGEGAVATRHILLGSVRLADITGTTGVSPVEKRYYNADGLDSTRLLTDASGDAIGTASYRAFGEVRTTGGSQLAATAPSAGWVGTLGVERDDATGLVFMRNRYYDAGQGRFIQMDPIGIFGGDSHFYQYVMNDPNNYVDPDGLSGVNGVGCGQWRDVPTRVSSGNGPVQPVNGVNGHKPVSIFDEQNKGKKHKGEDKKNEGNEDKGENGEGGDGELNINASVETRDKVRKVGQAGLVVGGGALAIYGSYKLGKVIGATIGGAIVGGPPGAGLGFVGAMVTP